ncbi:hypothetical protein SELSPUOL_01567 [Selenomonas sputigena ATCC 35185]|uniref:Uncharacterized protein n=1 Tax=Selenomonas sputigena (strain ATCC 35185 / DSM 20758 / CCUG 44933 / VPI D19B-28) TaxID=546271 RepID=C9LVS3_SELS3|nr:hypothetical protein SELSPUOL_01567 [Selenomonas sputigena ATCC 35185]
MRSHVIFVYSLSTNTMIRCFNTASGMRSHVPLCLGNRRNRRFKCGFSFPVM